MATERPNVIVVLADQLRRDALGIYGDPNVQTPHIDALAAAGVRFTAACSTYPICVPFRFTFMTGQYAHSRFVPAIEWRMSPAERTLADELNAGGYHTVYVGKWHLYGGHGHLPGHPPEKAMRTPVPRQHQGRWQKWLAFELANAPFETVYFEDDDPTPRPLKKYQTDGLFDLAMDHLAHHSTTGDGRPFFCVLSVEPPHFPRQVPPEYEARWQGRPIRTPPNLFVRPGHPSPSPPVTEADHQDVLEARRLYYAMIENLDDNVGRLAAFLRQTGLEHDTVVVLLSDHGEMGGAHAEMAHLKDHPYEEAVGIPLIVRDPRLAHRCGAAVDEPVSTEDLFPTFLAFAGVHPQLALPGMSLLPLIDGSAGELAREGVLLEFVHDLRVEPRWAPYHPVAWRGFRSRRYKYTVLGDAVAGGKPWQFFDLANDPFEMRNLVDDPASLAEVARHHRLLRDALLHSGDHYVLAAAFGCDALNAWQ